MKTNFIKVLTAVLVLAGCSNAMLEKDIDQKISQENDVKTRAALSAEATAIIENSKDLTSDQKAKLLALRNSTHQQIDENIQQSRKLRAVLIKDIVANNYNEQEIELIKGRLKKLDSKRLAATFDAIDQANKILGRQAHLNREVMTDFIRLEHF